MQQGQVERIWDTKMTVFLELLKINKMPSGHLCLELTEKVSWDDFSDYAMFIIDFLNGKIVEKSDGADLRIWDVCINGNKFQFIFDDFPVLVTLESSDDIADKELENIQQSLLKLEKNN